MSSSPHSTANNPCSVAHAIPPCKALHYSRLLLMGLSLQVTPLSSQIRPGGDARSFYSHTSHTHTSSPQYNLFNSSCTPQGDVCQKSSCHHVRWATPPTMQPTDRRPHAPTTYGKKGQGPALLAAPTLFTWRMLSLISMCAESTQQSNTTAASAHGHSAPGNNNTSGRKHPATTPSAGNTLPARLASQVLCVCVATTAAVRQEAKPRSTRVTSALCVRTRRCCSQIKGQPAKRIEGL
jgi:hypothetical protein